MLDRLANELNNTTPSDIALISYTRAAAQEMKERAVSDKYGKLGFVGTLHSLCFNLLELTRTRVMGNDELRDFGLNVGYQINGRDPMSSAWEDLTDGDIMLAELNYMVSVGGTVEEQYKRGRINVSFAEWTYFVQSYYNYKEEYGYVDFNDMIILCIDQGLVPDIKVLFVDEAQDLTPLMWDYVGMIEAKCGKAIIAGDDDQSIYQWNGANPQFLVDLAGANCWINAKVTVLSQTWRYGHTIWRLAEDLIETVQGRHPKEYKPRNDLASRVDHAPDLSYYFKDGWEPNTAILVRNHSIRRRMEDDLQQLGVPYVYTTGYPSPITNKTGKGIKAIMYFQNKTTVPGMKKHLKEQEFKAIRAVLKNPMHRELLDQNKLDFLDKYSWRHMVALPQALEYYYQSIDWHGLFFDPDHPGTVEIGTIHGSKGKEWDQVVLVNSMGAKTAETMMMDYPSEARVWYVGITRAIKQLTILEGDNAFPLPH